MFNIFDTGYETGECLFMSILGHVDNLNSKLKSN